MNIIFYIIVFLEGFSTLSVEIMSIRKSIFIIGSNSISTSIILGVILIALSYGYYKGGVLASNSSKEIIKYKIYRNLLYASMFYVFLSFPLENIFISSFLELNFGYFASILISIVLLFFIPVYLASQTIPLISELISSNKKAEVIGKLLFFSTIGSFFGSIVTSIVFFPFIGVNKSIILNSIILSILSLTILYIYKKNISKNKLIFNTSYLIFLVYIFIFFDPISSSNKVFSSSTAHNDIVIYDNGEKKLFQMNGSNSSGIFTSTNESYFGYINEIKSIIETEKPKNVLIIGAAGFSLPQSIAKLDFIENIDVCDIDDSLKNISEKYFLNEKLDEKINFLPDPARYFVNKKILENKKYDFIFIDAYVGKISIPSQLLTTEFFSSIKNISKGIISMNIILDDELKSDLYNNTIKTLNNNISNIYIKKINEEKAEFNNFIVINKEYEGYSKALSKNNSKIYYDNKNSLDYDKYNLFYGK